MKKVRPSTLGQGEKWQIGGGEGACLPPNMVGPHLRQNSSSRAARGKKNVRDEREEKKPYRGDSPLLRMGKGGEQQNETEGFSAQSGTLVMPD